MEGRNELRLTLGIAALGRRRMGMGWCHRVVSANTIESRPKMLGDQSRSA